MDNPEDIVFYGWEGEACGGFIRAVRKAAFVAGKIRDEAWMADFASTCLDGPALKYYESLSPDVQGDWRLLRQALLSQYPLPDQTGGAPGGNPSTTGAAPPPPQARRGRIKVIGENSTDFGYIGDGSVGNVSCIGAGAPVDDALLITYIPVGELHEIEIERQGGQNQVLGLHWRTPSPSAVIGSFDHANITVFNCTGPYRTSSMSWGGPGYTAIWKVMPDNTVWPHLGDDHSSTRSQVFSDRDSKHTTFRNQRGRRCRRVSNQVWNLLDTSETVFRRYFVMYCSNFE